MGAQIGFEERKIIEKMCNFYCNKEIAKKIGRDHTVVWRELNRCKTIVEYTAKQGQTNYNMLKSKRMDAIINGTDTPARLDKNKIHKCLEMKVDATPEEISFITGIKLEKVEKYYHRQKRLVERERKEMRNHEM